MTHSRTIANSGDGTSDDGIASAVRMVLVNHPLIANGWLETDDYQLAQAQPVGFDAARVSLTFDDGWKSIRTNALPLLSQYHMVSTQYLISGYLGQEQAYMSVSDVDDFRAEGSEIASHTVDHLDLTKQTGARLNFQLSRSQVNLQKYFSQATDFTAPYGTYDNTTLTAIAKSMTGWRLPNAQRPTPNAQRYHLWLILVYHQVDTEIQHQK